MPSERHAGHREAIRFFGTDSVFLGTDILVTNGERELNSNDRTVLVKSYDDMEQLTHRKRSVHLERGRSL